MEAQADQLGVTTAQKLVRGAVGEDELALLVGLDQGDGDGVQGLEQPLLGVLGHALDQIKLARGVDVLPALLDREPQRDEPDQPADGGDRAQHPHPIDLAFEKHST